MVFMSIITVVTIVACVLSAVAFKSIKYIKDIEVLRKIALESVVIMTTLLVLMTIDGWIRFVF